MKMEITPSALSWSRHLSASSNRLPNLAPRRAARSPLIFSSSVSSISATVSLPSDDTWGWVQQACGVGVRGSLVLWSVDSRVVAQLSGVVLEQLWCRSKTGVVPEQLWCRRWWAAGSGQPIDRRAASVSRWQCNGNVTVM